MELKKDGISDRNSKSFVQFIPFWGQKKSGILNVQKKETASVFIKNIQNGGHDVVVVAVIDHHCIEENIDDKSHSEKRHYGSTAYFEILAALYFAQEYHIHQRIRDVISKHINERDKKRTPVERGKTEYPLEINSKNRTCSPAYQSHQ